MSQIVFFLPGQATVTVTVPTDATIEDVYQLLSLKGFSYPQHAIIFRSRALRPSPEPFPQATLGERFDLVVYEASVTKPDSQNLDELIAEREDQLAKMEITSKRVKCVQAENDKKLEAMRRKAKNMAKTLWNQWEDLRSLEVEYQRLLQEQEQLQTERGELVTPGNEGLPIKLQLIDGWIATNEYNIRQNRSNTVVAEAEIDDLKARLNHQNQEIDQLMKRMEASQRREAVHSEKLHRLSEELSGLKARRGELGASGEQAYVGDEY